MAQGGQLMAQGGQLRIVAQRHQMVSSSLALLNYCFQICWPQTWLGDPKGLLGRTDKKSPHSTGWETLKAS